LPVEVGLQTETGYPHKGRLDYAAAPLNQSTGHASRARRAAKFGPRPVLPGLRPGPGAVDQRAERAVRADVALGSDQAGRYLLVVNGENIVEQRKVRVGPLEGGLRVIEDGLKADDRVITAGLAAGDSPARRSIRN
jgi:hypothetical protein